MIRFLLAGMQLAAGLDPRARGGWGYLGPSERLDGGIGRGLVKVLWCFCAQLFTGMQTPTLEGWEF